jgi:hypothetical protein
MADDRILFEAYLTTWETILREVLGYQPNQFLQWLRSRCWRIHELGPLLYHDFITDFVVDDLIPDQARDNLEVRMGIKTILNREFLTLKPGPEHGEGWDALQKMANWDRIRQRIENCLRSHGTSLGEVRRPPLT